MMLMTWISVVILAVIAAPAGRVHAQMLIRGPQNVTAAQGEAATFSCTYDGSVAPDSRPWVTPLFDLVDETTVALQTSNYILQFDNATHTSRLTILSVDIQDSGEYQCQLAGYSRKSASLSVIVLPRLFMSTSSQETAIIEGKELTVTCVASGAYPSASLTWVVDGLSVAAENANTTQAPSSRPLGRVDATSRLVIKPVRRDSGMLLVCRAMVAGDAFSVNQSMSLFARYAPDVAATMEPSSGSVREGSTLSITCRADSYPPVKSWQWFLNQNEIASARNQSSLILQNVPQAYDKQEVSCVAANDAGSGKWVSRISVAATARALLSVEDVELEIGQTASFACGVDVSPPLVVAWLKNGGSGVGAAAATSTRLVSNDGNITLLSFAESDSGLYTCMASVPGGNLTMIRSINVRLRNREIPWLYPVIGVGSGVAVVIIVTVAVVCCLKRQADCKKSEGTSSIMSGTTESSVQKRDVETLADDGSPRCDDRSSPWQHMSDCNGDTFSRLDYLPPQIQLKSGCIGGGGGGSSTAGTELCFQDALVYPTYTNNYLQFPECYKATIHVRAIPPPPPFNFYCASEAGGGGSCESTALASPVCSEHDSATTAIATTRASATAASSLDRFRAPSAVGFAEAATGTMHSVRQYAVSAVTECQLATNV